MKFLQRIFFILLIFVLVFSSKMQGGLLLEQYQFERLKLITLYNIKKDLKELVIQGIIDSVEYQTALHDCDSISATEYHERTNEGRVYNCYISHFIEKSNKFLSSSLLRLQADVYKQRTKSYLLSIHKKDSWQEFESYYFSSLPYLVFQNQKPEDFRLLYNSLLLSKGFWLAKECALRESILDCGNDTILLFYHNCLEAKDFQNNAHLYHIGEEKRYIIEINGEETLDDCAQIYDINKFYLKESLEQDSVLIEKVAAFNERLYLQLSRFAADTVLCDRLQANKYRKQQLFREIVNSSVAHYGLEESVKSNIDSTQLAYLLSYDQNKTNYGKRLDFVSTNFSNVSMDDSIKHRLHEELDNGKGFIFLQKYPKAFSVKRNYCDKINRKYLPYMSVAYLDDLITKQENFFCNYFSDAKTYTQLYDITWADVRGVLSEDDIAIEFLTYTDANGNDHYAALTLKSDYEYPHFITIAPANDLSTDNVGHRVWQQLSEELNGINNIYFSPIGLLHTIGIEYSVDKEGLIMNDKYNVFRLSSTRELVLRHENKNERFFALLGGADFNVPSVNSVVRSVTNDTSNNKRSIGVADLPGTRKEVKEIYKILSKSNQKAILFTDSLCSEYNLKSLSGKELSTLHIATHGLYEESATDSITSEMEQMNCSVLYLAGVNCGYLEEVDDGLITANEIANLDYSSVDLVVLSACDTGLGNISTDGVVGLQRGFKKAGVNSVFMSLWKVDDEATQILMTQFYKNYVAGKSKQKSLSEAQACLRNYKNGKYNAPEYWAAFILLDALD